MSVADQIIALQTNLRNAKTAVQTRGGTVTDSGLAGLENEILQLPKLPFKTKITYTTDSVDTSSHTRRTLNCSVSGFASSNKSIYGRKNNSTEEWAIISDGSISYVSDAELSERFGLTVTPTDPNGFCCFSDEIDTYIPSTASTEEAYVNPSELCGTSRYIQTNDGVLVERERITRVDISRLDDTVPQYFLLPAGFCNNMPSLTTVGGQNEIIRLENGCFSGCPHLTLTLGSICHIGSLALAGVKLVANAGIILGGNDIGAFAKPFSRNSSITILGDYLYGFWGMEYIQFNAINTKYVQLKGVRFGGYGIVSKTITRILSLEMCRNVPYAFMQKNSYYIDTDAPIRTQGTYGIMFNYPNSVVLARSVEKADNDTGYQGFLCSSNATEVFTEYNAPSATRVDDKTFAATDPTADIYATGLTLHVPSEYADDWRAVLPNSDTSPYRNVTVVGDYNPS